jgi:ABC-2 type transport system ATP-binding protein
VSHALRLHEITKRFGRHVALDNLSFEIPEGAICGLVGPNGAGKTTAFSVVSGYLQPDEGRVDILGQGPFDPYALKGRLGVLPQDAILPDRHTPRELLTHLARLQGESRRAGRIEAEHQLERVGLSDRINARIHTLSHGMQRRVAVATALVGNPDLVLLDEPLSGLDPRQAGSLRDALSELRGIKTLIISSHNLAELERLCDHVILLDRGSVVEQGPLDEVTGRHEVLVWTFAPQTSPPLDLLQAALSDHSFELESDTSKEGGHPPRSTLTRLIHHIPQHSDGDAATLVVTRILLEAGIPIRSLSRGQSLERAFFDSTARSSVELSM